MSELFETKTVKPKSNENLELYDQIEENNEDNRKISKEELVQKQFVLSRASSNSEDQGNDMNENSSRESNNDLHSDHQLENSCLKRHVFESFKNPNDFDEHENQMSDEHENHLDTYDDSFGSNERQIVQGVNSWHQRSVSKQAVLRFTN